MLQSSAPFRRAALIASLLGVLPWSAFEPAPVRAAEPHPSAAIKRGEHVARIVCSACHVVANDQEYPPILDVPGPAFAVVANRPATTEKSLRHFITTTHWDLKTLPMTMPNPMLTPEDTRAVALYILSLRSQ